MNWNYLGIDPDPPRRVQIFALHHSGGVKISNHNDQYMIAWAPIPPDDAVKRKCQIILRGLPELRMVNCILGDNTTKRELVTALAHYNEDDSLADFTDLVRALDHRAHNGVPCIANFHG